MNTDERMLKMLETILEGQERLEKVQQEQGKQLAGQGKQLDQQGKKLDTVQQDTAHISTALDAVRAGVEDVQAKQNEQANKTDVLVDLAVKTDKNTKSVKIRLEELEKDAGIHDRDKN